MARASQRGDRTRRRLAGISGCGFPYDPRIARFVLIHGAFGGAWCWQPLIGPLEAAGHTVHAPDLPGSGGDRTPLEDVTLDAYADRVCATLAERPEPAVLVGHSMGGVAVTQAAARCRELVASLVYVAAFLPRDGQSLLDLTRLPEGAGDQIQANMIVEGDPPVARLPDVVARFAVYGSCSDEQASWAVARRRPQAVAPFATPVALGDGIDDIPKAYVVCTRDRCVPPALQRRMLTETPCDPVVELDTDHAPWLSATAELADTLGRISGEAALAGSRPSASAAGGRPPGSSPPRAPS